LDHGEIAAAQRFSQILSPDAPPAFEKSRLKLLLAEHIAADVALPLETANE
jgi:hypothetical protein